MIGIFKGLQQNRCQTCCLSQIDGRQVIASLERVTPQYLQFAVQRDALQLTTIVESITARTVSTTRGNDVLAEHDADNIASVTY